MRKLAIFAGAFSAGIFLAQYLLPIHWLLPGAWICTGSGAIRSPAAGTLAEAVCADRRGTCSGPGI